MANYAQANNLYRNEGTTSKWLSVGLASTVSAPDGNGARVTAVVGSQRQTRTPDGGTGLGTQSVGPVLFGFGPTATSVDSLIVAWPSGLVTTQTGVSTNDTLTLSEPTPLYARTDEASSTLNSHSASWGDYDGDGDPDLYVTNYGQVDSLYRNDAGVMTPVAVTTMTTATSNSYGGAWGDYDGDGDPDLSVGIHEYNFLWRNDGSDAFTDVTSAAGIYATIASYSTSWVDFDRDGDLDLYWSNGGANVLYRNDGDGTFTDSGQAANSSTSQGATWGDYDGDGDPDLYVVNTAPNALYRNDAGVLTLLSGVAVDASSGRGATWGDYDDDGDLDLYVTNYSGTNVSNVLYRNDGGDALVDVSSGAGVASTSPSFSASWVDYDEDGLLDLYVANYFASGYSRANQLYRNGGDGTFVDVAQSVGVADGSNSPGAAWGDYDGDGDPDLYVTNYGMANTLYRNEGTTSKWLSVGLASTVSAPYGNGARVTAVVGSQRQTRMPDGGTGGYGGQSVGPVLFGFGQTTTSVDSLIVEWPSGLVTTQMGVATNDTLTLSEPSSVALSDANADGVPDLTPAPAATNAALTSSITATFTEGISSAPVSRLWRMAVSGVHWRPTLRRRARARRR